MAAIDKLIVTHAGALRTKYGPAGWRRIRVAVDRLIEADARRGLASRLLLLDSERAMRALGGRAASDPLDHQAAKDAVDAAFASHAPAYLLLLGAPDVVPHQPIANPALAPPFDPDTIAWSDLPYACSGRHGTDIARFTGPTRVVGRLPDLRGAHRAVQATFLVGLLDAAARWRSRPAVDYAAAFALSARVWRRSSERNVFDTFGLRDALRVSPPSGPQHAASALAPRAHFINCHGAEGSPEFQGQSGAGRRARYPVALTSRGLARKVAAGTVAAAECCYGAQLYASDLIGTDLPICQQYLAQGAYGFFGSTTIAYGDDADDDTAADLMVHRFLLHALAGESLGHAALHARQDFVSRRVDLDPIDLKTLAQFVLLGDPSIRPVARAHDEVQLQRSHRRARSRSLPQVLVAGDERARRRERRAHLDAQGRFLQLTRATAPRAAAPKIGSALKQTLAAAAAGAGIGARAPFRAYAVQAPVESGARDRGRRADGQALGGRRYFVAMEKPRGAPGGPHAVAVVVKAIRGRVVDVRRFRQR